MSMNRPIPGRDGNKYVSFEERTGFREAAKILKTGREKSF